METEKSQSQEKYNKEEEKCIMNLKRKLLAALTAVSLALTGIVPIAAFAANLEQTLYVDAGNDTGTEDGTSANPYTTIQAAVDEAARTYSSGYDVTIKVVWDDNYAADYGEYEPFWILSDNVTVEAYDETKKPVIKTLYSGEDWSYTGTTYNGKLTSAEVNRIDLRISQESGGIKLAATNITLNNLIVKSYGINPDNKWYAAPICTYNNNWGYTTDLTITGCEITYAGESDGYIWSAIFAGVRNMTVDSTTISGFDRAIYMPGVGVNEDSGVAGGNTTTTIITNCTLTGCGDEAIDIQVGQYQTIGIDKSTIIVTGNTVDNGIIQIWDQDSNNIAMDITLDDNELENGEIVLLQLDMDEVDLSNADDDYTLAYFSAADAVALNAAAITDGEETFLVTDWSSFNSDGTVAGATYLKSSSDGTSVTYIGSDGSLITLTSGVEPVISTTGGYAVNLELSLEPVTDESGEEVEGEYYIVLSGLTADENTAYINRFMSAQLKFKFDETYTDDQSNVVTCDITKIGALSIEPNADIDMTMIDKGDGEYEFNVDGENTDCVTATSVILGTATITGVGAYSLSVDTTYDTNQAHGAESANNIVNDFYYNDGTGTDSGYLLLDSTIPAAGTVKLDTTELTINVVFPNAVLTQNDDYTAMHISIEGLQVYGEDSEAYEIDLGTDTVTAGLTDQTITYYTDSTKDDTAALAYTGYTITVPVYVNYRYSLKFTGDGYRTCNTSIIPTGDGASVTVWNNVMDSEYTIITVNDDEEKTADVTFLAGDICMNGAIDLYDLSAVVSYFGKTGLIGSANYDTYNDYDLNRDGKIDSKDIAMVLVSWGK